MFDKKIYIERREKLKESLKNGVVVFPGNQESPRNYRGNDYHFEQDSTFLYYFGMNVPNLIGVIDIDNNQEYIFGTDFTLDDIVWMGEQKLLKSFAQDAGVNNFIEMTEFENFANNLITEKRELLFLPQYRAETVIQLSKAFKLNPFNFEENISEELIKAVVEQRNIKSQLEIEEIEKAVNITREMHLEAMRVAKPGMKEFEVVAAMEAVAAAAGCELSFATIATINGQTLHNHYHGNTVKSGDLFLIDAGAETEMGYAGDMSSTIPADKKFTTRQREVYEIQNAMHLESVKALRPGIPYMDVYDLSARVMVEGLKGLGLMKGNADDAVREGAHALFYPHGLGHMMGLDVHDMENLGELWVGYNGEPKSTQFGRKSQRLAIPLEPGFVHTVEPGIYFIPELIDMWKADKKFADFINYDKVDTYKNFGGIRNEEDYLITETGARRLGKKIPLTPEEVEEIR